MENSHCFRFNLRQYDKGIFDNFVDATYIITLENSKRIKNIEEQLSKYIPTKNIYIVYNKGFKKCDKVLLVQNSAHDITNTNFTIMNHSVKNNFNNILILEDDFVFSDMIKNEKIINDIEIFFEDKQKQKNKKFFYNLGPLPFLFYPNIYNNHYSGICCFAAQSIIYSKECCLDFIDKYKKNKININHDIFMSFNYKNYFYKYPLCYQTFPETENQNNWLDQRYFINKLFVNIFLSLI